MGSTEKKSKLLISQLICVICCIFFGWFALSIVYVLPQETINVHVHQSAKYFDKNYVVLMGGKASQLDNFTDALMLIASGTAGNESKSKSSLENLIYAHNGNPAGFIQNQFGKNNYESTLASATKVSYARYWHGYQLILRPLLMFLDYGEIRTLNMIIQFLLIVAIEFLLIQRSNLPLAIVVFATWLMLNPVSTILCLQFATVTNLTLFTILLILGFKGLRTKSIYLCSLFTILGAAINYCDFLSFPLFSLGFTLFFILYLQYELNKVNHNAIILILSLSSCWFLGYSGMWIGKWILTCFFTEIDLFSQVTSAIFLRGGSIVRGSEITYLDVLLKQFSCINYFWMLLFLTASIITFACLMSTLKQKCNSAKVYFPYLILASYPLVWFFILPNHSFVHSFFTFRTLGITFSIIWTIALNRGKGVLIEVFAKIFHKNSSQKH